MRLENEGLVTDAELPFRQVLAIYQRVLLANDLRIAIASYDLARCLHRQGKTMKPSVFAGPRWTSVSGAWRGKPEMGNYRRALGLVLEGQGKEVEAEAESKRAMAVRKAEPSLPAKVEGVRILRINRPLGGIDVRAKTWSRAPVRPMGKAVAGSR